MCPADRRPRRAHALTLTLPLALALACREAPPPTAGAASRALFSTPIHQQDAQLGRFEEFVVFAGHAGYRSRCPSGRVKIAVGSRWYVVDLAPLFPGGDGRLAAYCRMAMVKDYGQPTPAYADFALALSGAFFGSDPTVRVGPDPFGLYLQSKPLVDARWESHFRRFLVGASAVARPARLPFPPGGVPVRVEILDDVGLAPPARSIDLPASDGHGFADIRIAETLLCDRGDPTQGCAAEVTARQVMQRDAHLNVGTSHGSLGMLARGVFDAVQSAPDPRGLVLTLPLGWVNEEMGGLRGDIFAGKETPAAAAVHEALQYARCHSAAVLAAAGNRGGATGSPRETDLIFPARWEAMRAPRAGECQTEFGVTVSGSLPEVPLVSAVGAIDREDLPVGVAREHGEPELVAYGSGVVVPSRPPGHPVAAPPRTSLLFGTSPASVIAASAVALITRLGVGYDARVAEDHLRRSAPRLSGSAMQIRSRLGQTRQRVGIEAAASALCPSCALERPAWADDQAPLQRLERTAALTAEHGAPLACPSLPLVLPLAGSGMELCERVDAPSQDELPITGPQPRPVGGGNDPTIQVLGGGAYLLGLVSLAEFVPELLELRDAAGHVYVMELPGGLPFDQYAEVELFLDPSFAPVVHPATALLVGRLPGGMTDTEPVRVEY